MGIINTYKNLIGVNNINTANAQAGLVWPALVRKVLKETNLSGMRQKLIEAPVTSGHNYLISSLEGGEHWEITPRLQEKVAEMGSASAFSSSCSVRGLHRSPWHHWVQRIGHLVQPTKV